MILSITEIKKYIKEEIPFPKIRFSSSDLHNIKFVNLPYFMKWFDPDNLIFEYGEYRILNKKSCKLQFNRFSDFKTEESGDPINFLEKVYKYDRYKCMYILHSFIKHSSKNINKALSVSCKDITKDDILDRVRDGVVKPIDGIKNIYAYLLYTIGLDVDFIDYLKDNNFIFAEDNGEKIKNIIFPHYEDVKENSIIDLVGYDVYGTLSDKKFCRCETYIPFSNFFIDSINYDPSNKHYVYIFESDLDLICFYYLYERSLIEIDDNFILISCRGRFKEIAEKYINDKSVIVSCVNDLDFSMSLLHYKDNKAYDCIYGCSEFFNNKEFKSFKEMVKYKEDLDNLEFKDIFEIEDLPM